MHRRGKRAADAMLSALVILSIVGLVALAGVALSANTCCLEDNVKTITLASASLFGGVLPTNASSRGTSTLAVILNNPGTPTSITSITITGSGLSYPVIVYQCSSNISCKPLSGISLPSDLDHFDTNSTAFYLSGVFTEGQVYNYVINFGNGQSVSGSLIDEGAVVLPDSPPNYAVNAISSSSSSVCTPITPYTTTYTEHYGNDSAVTFETAEISCGVEEAQSTFVYYSYTSSACTTSPYVTTETINSSQTMYTTVTTANNC